MESLPPASSGAGVDRVDERLARPPALTPQFDEDQDRRRATPRGLPDTLADDDADKPKLRDWLDLEVPSPKRSRS